MTGRLLLAAVLVLAGPSVGAAELQDPQPIPVPAGRAPALVDRAIHWALACRGWALRHQGADEIRVAYSPGNHSTLLSIRRDAAAVRIEYRDSYALGYEVADGRRYIHKNYNAWVEALAATVAAVLARPDLRALPDLQFTTAGHALVPLHLNPAPARALSSFASFELAPVELAPGLDSGRDERVAAKLQRLLDDTLSLTLQRWSAAAGARTQTLRIEPLIVDMFQAGAGSRPAPRGFSERPYLLLQARFVDADSGAVVALPSFYAEAVGPQGIAAGRSSNDVINGAAAQLADYTKRNHDAPVAGIGGMPSNVGAVCGTES